MEIGGLTTPVLLARIKEAAICLEANLPSDLHADTFERIGQHIDNVETQLRAYRAEAGPGPKADEALRSLRLNALPLIDAATLLAVGELPKLSSSVALLGQQVKQVRAETSEAQREVDARSQALQLDHARRFEEEVHRRGAEARSALDAERAQAAEHVATLDRLVKMRIEANRDHDRQLAVSRIEGAQKEEEARAQAEEVAKAQTEQMSAAVSKAITDANTYLKRAMDDSAQIVADAKSREAATVAIAQARFFKELAETHRTAAWGWLIATGTAAVLFVGGMIVLAHAPNFPVDHEPKRAFDVARYFSLRAFAALVGSFILTVCIRNYRANQHNEVVNRHRQKALETFEGLSFAAVDPRIRDALLMQASTAVFTVHPTGYLATGEDLALTQGTIIDAMKLATGTPPAPAPPTAPP